MGGPTGVAGGGGGGARRACRQKRGGGRAGGRGTVSRDGTGGRPCDCLLSLESQAALGLQSWLGGSFTCCSGGASSLNRVSMKGLDLPCRQAGGRAGRRAGGQAGNQLE